MFLSPLAKRQNSTLKYWQLYRIQLLKWSSWRHFNMEASYLHTSVQPVEPQTYVKSGGLSVHIQSDGFATEQTLI
jgi:hypothetical protein